MRNEAIKSVRVAAVLIALAAASPAQGDDIGHEQARLLVEEGRILPLAEIVERVGARVPGKVLEVELDLDDGSYVYELKILGRDGRVREVEVEAATGEIVDIEDDD